MEAAGTVIDVGEGASGFLPGDRIAYLGAAPGAYASVRTVPANWVVRLPVAVEDDVAAAILLKGITADLLLRDLGHVGRGTRLLVHAAAGGLGLLARVRRTCGSSRARRSDRSCGRPERRQHRKRRANR